jgi:hydrogenase-4 membrane subunit HyfE
VTSLLIGFVIVLLVPLFVGTWRISLLGLSLQGLLLYGVAYRLEGADTSAPGLLTAFDLIFLRGILAPALLYRVLQLRRAPERNDVLPPNLIAWAAAIGLVLGAFRLALLLVPVAGDEQLQVGAAAAAVLLGFLVLSSQGGVFSQIVGALRIENAIALFELGTSDGHGSLGLRCGQLFIFGASLLLFRWYLSTVDPAPPVHHPIEELPDLKDIHP